MTERPRLLFRLAPGLWPTPIAAAEYQETRDKASAMLRALEMAQTGGGPSSTDGIRGR